MPGRFRKKMIMTPEPEKMGKKPTVLWIGGAVVLLIAISIFCLAGGVLTGGLIWRVRQGAASQVKSNLLQRTPTFSKQQSAATLSPVVTFTEEKTSVIQLTLTQDWLNATQTISIGTPPVTDTLILSGTHILSEPTSSPVPAYSSWCVPLNSPYQNAWVLKVIDGVEIQVEMEGAVDIVRYLGIALPDDDIGSPAWESALSRNQALVEGKEILLARDRSNRDIEGRLLRYVISEGVFVNLDLVENGHAVAQRTLPDVSCSAVFEQAEARARLDQRGVWGPTPTPTRTPLPPTPTIATIANVRIAFIKFWGVGWQDPNEFVEIRNDSAWPVQLSGWSLSDLHNHRFIFPGFVLKPGAYCRIYTHKYVPGMCTFSFYHPAGIWDDGGDCAFLKDATGALVDQLCYDW